VSSEKGIKNFSVCLFYSHIFLYILDLDLLHSVSNVKSVKFQRQQKFLVKKSVFKKFFFFRVNYIINQSEIFEKSKKNFFIDHVSWPEI
jgi:hypothetical protein